jgi:hypothetical protein
MGKAMKADLLLFLIVFVVWMVLAGIYALVPMFHMPGYAKVWGLGSLIFLILALLTWTSGRRFPGTTGPDMENERPEQRGSAPKRSNKEPVLRPGPGSSCKQRAEETRSAGVAAPASGRCPRDVKGER